ncbi:MAG TPA: M28 family metallopeptidase [Terriglobales bacterium]|nr:M28 family metallopeptidase [Terriglobales bacterium]
MKIKLAVIVVISVTCSAQTGSLMGFRPQHAMAERKVEAQFKSHISPDRAREFHRYFTSEPHTAGSERNNELARYIADTWKQQGLEDVVIREYDVLNSFPKQVALEMVAPVNYKATLREAAYDVDPDTKNPNVRSGWLSMSASGDVTAPIVYAHSGNPSDYELLKKQGIAVRGKLVLVRYSNPYSYRGFKALTAQREGAAGILIYSDPAEDGYKKGKVFPDGPWGPETHIQRGAITYDFIVPGDPLTPGWASVPGAKHIRPEDAESLPKIMAVALSWADAKPLLENMGGPVAPKEWQGGLPIKYRLGGEGKVHLKIDMDNRVMPNYVVEARIRGTKHPDEWVVLGNHRDAWEFGGVDPSSGTASMMEMTRAFGDILKNGTRPDRTLVFCSWDGEEVGLTGSTEWGEQFADDLKQKAVAYLNVDSSTSGPDFEGSAVGSLAPFLVEVTRSVEDPASKTSLYEAWKRYSTKKRRESKSKVPVTDATLSDVRIGSGSDHTVFLNHDGVPVIGLQFDGPYGVYHSMYDDFFWMNHFGDPGYRYHALMSQLWGVTAMRLANADALPLDVAAYTRYIRDFVIEVSLKPDAKQNLQLQPVLESLAALEKQGTTLNAALQTAPEAKLQIANHSLMQIERNWLNEAGIPGRPWFKHVLYAARYTYAHLELPGLTEAVEKKDWKTGQEQADILRAAIAKNAALLKETIEALKD